MAKEKSQIVIKKVIVAGGGHHGGSWKVALADFMTAMMAFFLVMWLLGQSEDQKKAIADYFSTPSVIEYNFQNYGVEVTLEKLFLDFVNEPLKAVQDFVQPMDRTPDLLDMGSAKVVMAAIADQMNDYAKNVNVTPEGFTFDIPDYLLFERGTAKPATTFIDVMEKLKAITVGLEDAEIRITSGLFVETVPGGQREQAKNVAQERVDIVSQRVKAGLEHPSVSIEPLTSVIEDKEHREPSRLVGIFKFQIFMKEKPDSKPRRKLETAFGKSSADMNVYDNFVKQLSEAKVKKKPAKSE